MTINEKYLDKVLSLLGYYGENPERVYIKTSGLWGYKFPCPFCAMHQKSDSKKRKKVAYLLPHQNSFSWTFFCHRKDDFNCKYSMRFDKFLERLNPSLYKKYQREKYDAGNTGKGHCVPNPTFNFNTPKFS